MKKLILVLGLVLATALNTPARALDLGNLTPAEKDAFGAQVRDYLLSHPEVLVQAIQALDARKAQDQAHGDAARIAAHAGALFHDPKSWTAGNPKGDITIVEFMDYRCPYCRKAYPEVNTLVRSDGNIRYIVKEFPILGPQSVLASRFAIAVLLADGPEAYGKIHDALMTARGDFTPAFLEHLAARFGLDGKKLLERAKADDVSKVIADNLALGDALQISGTPTFVVKDRMLRGYMPLDGMKQLVDEARTGP